MFIIQAVACGQFRIPLPLFFYDANVDVRQGRGSSLLTTDPETAMGFDSIADAQAFWEQSSKVRPMRPDGLPNKPLTAFSINVIPRHEAVRVCTPAEQRT